MELQTPQVLHSKGKYQLNKRETYTMKRKCLQTVYLIMAYFPKYIIALTTQYIEKQMEKSDKSIKK